MCRKLAAKAILRPQFREVGHGPVFILGAPSTALVNVNVCSVYLLCMWLHLSLGPVQFQPNPNRICLSLIDRQATMEVLVLKVRSCRNPVKAQNTWNCKSVADSICNCVWMVKWRRHDRCGRTIQGIFSYFFQTHCKDKCLQSPSMTSRNMLARQATYSSLDAPVKQAAMLMRLMCNAWDTPREVPFFAWSTEVDQTLSRCGLLLPRILMFFTMCSFVRASCAVRVVRGPK